MEKVSWDRSSPYPIPTWGSSFINNLKIPGMMGSSNYAGGFLVFTIFYFRWIRSCRRIWACLDLENNRT
jgi:hypothetical protein